MLLNLYCKTIYRLTIIVLESTDNVEYADKELCFDDLVKKKIIQLQIIDESKTKIQFLILIIFITLSFICRNNRANQT